MGFQQGLSGLNAASKNLDVIGHNIANANTTGFKASRAEFADMVAASTGAAGGRSNGMGVEVAAVAQQFTQGGLTMTGNNLDVAINGNGFFGVTMPDGTIGYTRDGSFQLDAQGRLTTSSGLPVANGITIPAGDTSVSISAEGAVSALVAGSTTPQPLGNLAMSSFINPAGLEPTGQNLFKESAASGQPQQGTPGTNGLGYIRQGFLEASNVNVVEELVTMIQTQRAYEMNSKAIQTSDQMLQKLGQL